MTKGDAIRNFPDTVFAEWLTLIEEKAIEHQHVISSLSHDTIKNDWINFLKEKENESNS